VSLLGNDSCEANTTRDYPDGDIAVEVEWPETPVGSRRIVRCPYAYDQPSYAHRDCTLSFNDQKPQWNDPNITSCPGPPFSQGVDRLARFTVSDLWSVVLFVQRRKRNRFREPGIATWRLITSGRRYCDRSNLFAL